MESTTAADVAFLLENFSNYMNPDGEHDPWFTLAEINQQFVWDDLEPSELVSILDKLVVEGKAEARTEGQDVEWRWLS